MKKDKIKIAIVEDSPFYHKVLTRYIKVLCNPHFYYKNEFEITSYYTAEDCIEKLDEDTDIMLLDYLLINEEADEYLTGDDVLKEVKRICPDCKVIVFSEQQNVQVTVEMMKKGIYEYIDKKTNDHNRVGAVIQKILKERNRATA